MSENPKMMGVIVLEGQKDVYRYRVGDDRIVFRILDQELQVLVLDVKPRGEVYKKY
ncbi:type II toxin-antitoxin system RelE/ParE family toxin [Massilia sp. W12]|uniref:type II toxin-antitoxin system RelE family toxin n=1 Tax=Massilia sp. W12 TaxID=3126507 RepID=UPI0030CE1791